MDGFVVRVGENSRYMDEDAAYTQGRYDSWEAALAAAMAIVDEYLARAFKPGMQAADLFSHYTMFGEDPYIVPESDRQRFSARDYARMRCAQIVALAGGDAPAR